jgi:peptidoglycan hydrolase CwlO-like protein
MLRLKAISTLAVLFSGIPDFTLKYIHNMLIVSWFLRIIALVAAALSFVLYFKIEGELATRNQRIESQQADLLAAKNQVKEYSTSEMQAKSRAERFETQVNDLRKELAATQEKVRQANTSIGELKDAENSLKNQRTQLELKILDLEKEITSARSNSIEDELRKRLEERNSTIDQLSATLAEREKERDNYKQELDNIKARSTPAPTAPSAGATVAAGTATTPSAPAAVAGVGQGSTVTVAGNTTVGKVLRADPSSKLVIINMGAQHNIKKDQQLVTFQNDSNVTFTLQVTAVYPDYSITSIVSRSGSGKEQVPAVGAMVTKL